VHPSSISLVQRCHMKWVRAVTVDASGTRVPRGALLRGSELTRPQPILLWRRACRGARLKASDCSNGRAALLLLEAQGARHVARRPCQRAPHDGSRPVRGAPHIRRRDRATRRGAHRRPRRGGVAGGCTESPASLPESAPTPAWPCTPNSPAPVSSVTTTPSRWLVTSRYWARAAPTCMRFVPASPLLIITASPPGCAASPMRVQPMQCGSSK